MDRQMKEIWFILKVIIVIVSQCDKHYASANKLNVSTLLRFYDAMSSRILLTELHTFVQKSVKIMFTLK